MKLSLLKIFLVLTILPTFLSKSISEVVKVNYKLSHSKICKMDTLQIEFTFKIKKDWHIYWINPGDAGIATTIQVNDSPIGKQIELLMPVPKIVKDEDLTFYCYENQVKMIALFLIDHSVSEGFYNLPYSVSWLMCKNECYPGNAYFNIPIEVSHKSAILNKFNLKDYPKTNDLKELTAQLINEKIYLLLNKSKKEKIEFYPLTQGYIVYNQIQSSYTDTVQQMILTLDKFRENDPEEIEGLFVAKETKSNKIKNSFYSKIKIIK